MNASLLRTSRWALIVILSAILGYLAYTGISAIVAMIFTAEATFASWLKIMLVAFLAAWIALIPAIMLYSLITKKLKGFASCIGLVILLAAFYVAVTLPDKMGLLASWSSITFLPDTIKIITGLVLSITLLFLPIWLIYRLIRLTNEWIYPSVFKPLEEKL